MLTILWLIERLLVNPTDGTNTNVVITADWRCNGTVQSPTEAYSGTCYGSASFAPPTENFTPYEDLTQDQVLGWCFANGVDQAAIEANVNQQIQNQINPPVVVLPLPWVPPAPEPQPEPVTDAPSAPVVVADEAPVADAPAA